jgi:hypothetical protein
MHAIQVTTGQARFCGQELPLPPEHVPDKFKEVWKTLPGCCRQFYLNPGKGCCAGLPEPKPKMMEANLPLPASDPANRKGISAVRTAATQRQRITGRSGIIASTMDWFRRFVSGLWEDLKLLLAGPKG